MQWSQLPVLGLFLCALCPSVLFCEGLLPARASKSPVDIWPKRSVLTTNSLAKVGDTADFKSDVDDTPMKALVPEIIGSLSKGDQSARVRVVDLGCGNGILWESMIEEAEKSSLELQITGVIDSPTLAKEAESIASILVKRYGGSRHQIDVVRSNIQQYIQSQDESSNFDCAVLNYCGGDRSFELREILMEALEIGIEKICVVSSGGAGSENLKSLPKNSIEVAIETHQLPVMLSKMETESFYFVGLEKCRGMGLQHIHWYKGLVSNGYGRGGKKLGVPTANLPSSLFQQALEDVDTGVYFGWAAIEDLPGKTFKAVVNVGYSPTFESRENKEKIIEAHLILKNGEKLHDFYGSFLRLKLLGYLRPECKFDSFDSLINQINADISDSDKMLDATPFKDLSVDRFFDTSKTWIGSGGGDKAASWEFSMMLAELEYLSENMA